jgi:hypothetical protein
MPLYCAICIFTHEGTLDEDHEAITVMGGNAVCQDHLGYSADPKVSNAIHFFRTPKNAL